MLNHKENFAVVSFAAKIISLLNSDSPNDVVCRQIDIYMREDGIAILSKSMPKLTIDKWVDNRTTIFQLIAAFRRSSTTQE